MTEDTSLENLRKFLESDDPAMVQMGLSMTEGIDFTEEFLPTILGLYMWNDDKTVRAIAKSAFIKNAPDKLKDILKKTWKTDYRKIKTVEIVSNHVTLILWNFKNTILDTINVWRPALFRTLEGRVQVTHTIIKEMVFFGVAPQGYLSTINDSRMKEASPSAGRMGNTKSSAETVETLTELLDLAMPSKIRHAIIETVCNIGDERAVKPLIKTLEDKDGYVRESAAISLGNIGDKRAVGPLISSLENDESVYVRARSAEALGKICDARAVESLIKSHSDYNGGSEGFCPLVPCYAIEALAKIGDTRAVEPLIMSLKTTYTERYLEYLQSSKTYLDYLDMLDHNMIGMLLKGKLRKWPSFFRDRVRFKHPQLATIWALGEMGDKSAVKPLIKTFESENLDQIKVAAKAIVKIKENDIGDEKENIMKFLESDDQGMVRMGASMLKGILEE